MLGNKPSKKKVGFPISDSFYKYLNKYNRYTELPLQYEDMNRYIGAVPLLDEDGNDTHWKTVIYPESDAREMFNQLCEMYAYLKTDGDFHVIEHLDVDRIDYCSFGNTNPFRVRIINKLNDNYDHFYIKTVDASRIYGLELEDILSPNRVTYVFDHKSLIEEHIAGIPGDDFIKNNLDIRPFDQIRIAKEFIKFNERCFIRLLGDMRAYNFIVDITPDISGFQYRIRSIDFDQQSYEGRMRFYLPQYFKENNDIIKLGFKHLSFETVTQYQAEERSLIARRARSSKSRLNALLRCMVGDQLSFTEKVDQLKKELAQHHQNDTFLKCSNMGELVFHNLKLLLLNEFKQSIINI
jgi:hypothetical protein